MVRDLVFGAQARHLPARKVGPVVGDDSMGKSELTHDVLLEEHNNLPHCDIGERYCLYPYFRRHLGPETFGPDISCWSKPPFFRGLPEKGGSHQGEGLI